MYYAKRRRTAKAKREPTTSTKINCTIKGGKLCKQPTKRGPARVATPQWSPKGPAQWQEICIIIINTGELRMCKIELRQRGTQIGGGKA